MSRFLYVTIQTSDCLNSELPSEKPIEEDRFDIPEVPMEEDWRRVLDNSLVIVIMLLDYAFFKRFFNNLLNTWWKFCVSY